MFELNALLALEESERHCFGGVTRKTLLYLYPATTCDLVCETTNKLFYWHCCMKSVCNLAVQLIKSSGAHSSAAARRHEAKMCKELKTKVLHLSLPTSNGPSIRQESQTGRSITAEASGHCIALKICDGSSCSGKIYWRCLSGRNVNMLHECYIRFLRLPTCDFKGVFIKWKALKFRDLNGANNV